MKISHTNYIRLVQTILRFFRWKAFVLDTHSFSISPSSDSLEPIVSRRSLLQQCFGSLGYLISVWEARPEVMVARITATAGGVTRDHAWELMNEHGGIVYKFDRGKFSSSIHLMAADMGVLLLAPRGFSDGRTHIANLNSARDANCNSTHWFTYSSL